MRALEAKIDDLIRSAGLTHDATYYRGLFANIVKLGRTHPDTGDLKLFTRAFREMRIANHVFAAYKHVRKVAVFGSARSHPESAESLAAEQFSRSLVAGGFMVITGGGDGIMGAAQRGAGRERSFGLNIQLPFEQSANEVILNDPKLITFRYFFTRKLHFVKESHAVAIFPGGFGTMDEAFETLTLVQTGKARIVPLVFVDAPGGDFWHSFVDYLRDHLLADGLISPEDFHLFKVTTSLEEAQAEIFNFYRNYHSYRYVRDTLVIRMQRAPDESTLAALRDEFADICSNGGSLHATAPLDDERSEPDILHLPRLALTFNRRSLGRLRQLIDRINSF
jgi:hypothetical protein